MTSWLDSTQVVVAPTEVAPARDASITSRKESASQAHRR